MDFSFSEEQTLLRNTVERFVQDNYDFDSRRKITASDEGFSRENWQQMAELGLLAAPFSEEQGGLGGGPIDVMVLMNYWETLRQTLWGKPRSKAELDEAIAGVENYLDVHRWDLINTALIVSLLTLAFWSVGLGREAAVWAVAVVLVEVGFSLVRMRVSELSQFGQSYTDTMLSFYRNICEQKAPVAAGGPLAIIGKGYREFEGIYMPFTETGDRVDRLMAVVVYL